MISHRLWLFSALYYKIDGQYPQDTSLTSANACVWYSMFFPMVLHTITAFSISSTYQEGSPLKLTAVILQKRISYLPVKLVPFKQEWKHLDDLILANPSSVLVNCLFFYMVLVASSGEPYHHTSAGFHCFEPYNSFPLWPSLEYWQNCWYVTTPVKYLL